MGNTTLHLYKVFNHAIDYSKVFSNNFAALPKQYYGSIDLSYYLPLDDDIDIQLGSELLRSKAAASKNLFNPNMQFYESDAIISSYDVIGDKVQIRTTTLSASPYAASKFYVTGLTVGNSYTFRGYYTIIEGTEDANTFNFRIQCCNTSKVGSGTSWATGSGGSQTFTATEAQAIIWCVNRNTSSTQAVTNALYYNMQLEAGSSATSYEANTYSAANAFNDINYIVAVNDDETRYYFVKDKKKRVAHNTRVYSLKSDEWFNKELWKGIDCIQYGGHASDKFDLWERKEYIEKPRWNDTETALTTAAVSNASNSNVTGTVIVFYKTPTNVISVAKSYISNTLLYDICTKLFSTNRIRLSSGVEEVDVTPIRAYIIPNAFTNAAFSTTYDRDISTNAGVTWNDNYCRYIIIGELCENSITINLNHNAQTYPYANKTISEIIGLNLPLKITVGVTGHTYDIDSPIFRDNTTNCVIKTRLLIGTNDLSASIQADFTDNKWVEVSSAFEEVVTYSAYYDYVNQNRNSIATQRTLNYVSMGIGAVGALSGNVTGLVSAIGSYATTESSIADLKHKNCISVGNQGGFMNITYSETKGAYLFICYKQTCSNSQSVYEAILRYGYNFDRVSTNTSDLISLKHYTYETQAKTTYIDTELVEPITSVYNSFRYMVADLVHATSNAIIPEDVKTAFKKGCYVFNTPVLS
jgi:hypothetical protein